MYWVNPILKRFSLGRDSQVNPVDKAYKIEDVQK